MEYNAPTMGEKYRDITRAMGVEKVDEISYKNARKAAFINLKYL